MRVKAQGLVNGVKWIEEQYGPDTLDGVLRYCGPTTRERCRTATAMEWHPLGELLEFVGAADRFCGVGNGTVAEAIGAAGARANMKGISLRFFFYLSNQEALMRRIAGLWRQYNDEGSMRVLESRANFVSVEVSGIRTPHWLFCAVLTGWAREVASVVSGSKKPTAKHVSCELRGDVACIWHMRWGEPL